MKVSNLIEGEEWENQFEPDLNFLWKKQLSTCHQFLIAALKAKYYRPEQEEFVGKWLSISTAKKVSTLMPGLASSSTRMINFQTLYGPFDRMVAAKKAYEAAGGTYKRLKG